MLYCLKHSIRTPDGTVLTCKHNHDYQTHKDLVADETYMIDGIGYAVRSSINRIQPEDLSVWVDSENPELTKEVRHTKFWRSYGKNNEHAPYGVYLSLAEMQTDHIEAILCTQYHIKGSVVEKLMQAEYALRNDKQQ